MGTRKASGQQPRARAIRDLKSRKRQSGLRFVGNLQTQAITLYAKGYKSTASGILGVDESWTITAN